MTLIGLAEVRELELRKGVYHFPKGSILATVEGMRGVLYCFGPGQERQTDKEPTDQAFRDYHTFHGFDGFAVSSVLIPDNWIRVGAVRSVLYVSDKVNGGGDGTINRFRHVFNSGTVAYISEENPDWMKVEGESLFVDERGIVN